MSCNYLSSMNINYLFGVNINDDDVLQPPDMNQIPCTDRGDYCNYRSDYSDEEMSLTRQWHPAPHPQSIMSLGRRLQSTQVCQNIACAQAAGTEPIDKNNPDNNKTRGNKKPFPVKKRGMTAQSNT